MIDPVQSTRAVRDALGLMLGASCLLLSSHAAAQQLDPPVVIRQVFGGGGNSGAPYTNDFVELFNRSAATVSLAGWSLQYTSATGSANLGASASTLTLLPSVSLQAGQSYLVQEAGGSTGAALPSADLVGTINLASTAGKVALVSSSAGLGCGGATPCSAAQLGQVVDLLGYGNASFFEGSAAAPSLSNTTAALRAAQGCSDSNDNRADFVTSPPAPHNTATALAACSSGTGSIGACGDPVTPIAAIQGSGAASPLIGSVVNIEAVVVGDFQNAGIRGFFVQTPDAKVDADPNTSEGLFVFAPASKVALAPGDLVRVRGQVSEFQSLTELGAVSAVLVCGTAQASPQLLRFPVRDVAELEHYEGMLTHIDQALTVTGNFDLGRFGSLDLSVGGRLYQPTNVVAPGAAANALQSANDRSRIILDDASSAQNPNPIPYKDANNTRRVGDSLPALVGVLDGRFGAYRIQPTAPLAWNDSNPRPAAPANVAGRLRVGFANVLNFFTTLDNGSPVCGPTGGLDCRGANTAAEFDRQRTKLLNALRQLDLDVVGLSELENNSSASIQSLVDGLNAQTPGSYAFVDTGTIGTDAIKVGILYKPAKVTALGGFALLTSAVNPLFIDTKNRPTLAQTFVETASNARFTLVVNHFKSKGSDCSDVSDPDTGDGQGNCNQTRNKAAQALLAWIATDPTHSGDPDFLIVGDLNSYAKEDPLSTLKAGGFQALLETLVGPSLYSYQFNGQSGALDHVLASASLASQVGDVSEWHNNADEPVVLDYNTEFKTDDPFNANDPFRGSDHDPILVGLNLSAPVAVPVVRRWHCGVLGPLLVVLGAKRAMPRRSKACRRRPPSRSTT
jgi:uncharacterized protein